MSNPEMDVALKLRGRTLWLRIEANALPPHPDLVAMPVTKEQIVDVFGPLLHAVAIDKVYAGEPMVDDRYVVRAADF